MKAQRRRELKENVLAHELGRLKRLLDVYGNWIAGGIAAVAIVFLVVWYYHSRSQRQLAEEQQEYKALRPENNPTMKMEERIEKLNSLAEHAKSDIVGASAAILLGDLMSDRYVDGMCRHPPEDNPEYRQKAEQFYNLAMTKYPEQKMLVAKAHYALAVLAETAGDFAAAKSEYEAVGKHVDAAFPVAALAQQHLALLPTYSRPVRMATTTQATQTATGAAATKTATSPRPAPRAPASTPKPAPKPAPSSGAGVTAPVK